MTSESDNCTTLQWQRFSHWIHCICVVTFDLELGQALEHIYPKHVALSKQEVLNICYLAFPDSNSGCMGDTTFVIRLPRTEPLGINLRSRITSASNLTQLDMDQSYLWGFVYFRQEKDSTLPRGYLQKSVVILTKLPFNNLFFNINRLIAPDFFQYGMASLEACCTTICDWPMIIPDSILNLPLLGNVLQVHIPRLCTTHVTHKDEENVFNEEQITQKLSIASPQSVIQAEDMNYFDIFQPVLFHLHLLWELVLTCEPVVVMSCSPEQCSMMVLALTRIISPLKFCGDFRPYFTIHDSEFKRFTSTNGTAVQLPPVILGVTNPFFSKTLQHWPHTIRLTNANNTLGGPPQKFHLKRRKDVPSTKMSDNCPGLYTSYKPYLNKDRTIIKKLINGMDSKRPLEVQSAILRRHLLELTQSFIIPLERYIASLMPLQKDIYPFKAAPEPFTFNPDAFLATLDATGPHLTTGIKGDWIGLYKRFFRSANFNGWFNARYNALALKLQALHLKALSEADLTNWMCGRAEVEIIDMVLRLKNKILQCEEEHQMPIEDDMVCERLRMRLKELMTTLPDDLKTLFA